MCPCLPTGEVRGIHLHVFSCEALLKAWPAARYRVWLHNRYLKSSAAPLYGRDSNEGKSTVESISAVVLMSDPAFFFFFLP